ncbi:hypothetical protein Syun_008621 [Stephania yunnanensis]|uniref:Glucosidase II beta subunit N-terminal domain-containing protein n=1 Tax=Stephania yunnanensis TaxID=152371 RepID=A0AAP0KD71_9MAGN
MVVGWASSIALVFATLLFATLLFACSSPSGALPADRAAGIRPEATGVADAKFYDSEIIACRDGSNSFSRARLNDDFCDCADGTDEPGIFTARSRNSWESWLLCSVWLQLLCFRANSVGPGNENA